MGSEKIKCKRCQYVFIGDQQGKETVLTCPYCKYSGNGEDFTLLGSYDEDEGETFYSRTFNEFQDALRQIPQEKLRKFFKNKITGVEFHIQDGKVEFRKFNGPPLSYEEIHSRIQNDVTLQRDFYNLWMSHYR